MTMWRPNEPVEEDVSELPSIAPRSKRLLIAGPRLA